MRLGGALSASFDSFRRCSSLISLGGTSGLGCSSSCETEKLDRAAAAAAAGALAIAMLAYRACAGAWPEGMGFLDSP